MFVPNFKKEGSDDSDEDFEDFTPTKNEVLETPKDTAVEKGAKKSKKASSSADDEDLPF